MTKEEFLTNLKQLTPLIEKAILEKAETFVNSGAVDFESYENNYLLPKYFLSACGSVIEDLYSPYPDDKRGKAEVKNIKLFI